MAYRALWWAFPVAVFESRAQLRSFSADAVCIPNVRFSQSASQGLYFYCSFDESSILGLPTFSLS
jgi:hypothetical protein